MFRRLLVWLGLLPPSPKPAPCMYINMAGTYKLTGDGVTSVVINHPDAVVEYTRGGYIPHIAVKAGVLKRVTWTTGGLPVVTPPFQRQYCAACKVIAPRSYGAPLYDCPRCGKPMEPGNIPYPPTTKGANNGSTTESEETPL